MAFDSLCMRAVVSDLSSLLSGAKVTKVQQPDRYTIILRLHGPNGNSKLLLSAHPVYGRLHLTEHSPENPAAPPLFCMVLRKHLENARINQIRQCGNDRIVHLDFDASDEIGNPVKRRLILEIMGKHSNLILIDSESGLILDGVRRYSHNLSRHREVLPGREYIDPPATDKLQPEELDYDGLCELIMTELAAGNSKPVNILYQRIDGISPFLARELIAKAGLDQMRADEFGEYEYAKLWQALEDLAAIKAANIWQPVLLKDGRGYYDYYPIRPLSIPAAEQEAVASIGEALDFFYQVQKEQGSFNGQRTELAKLIAKEAQRLQKKIALQQADLASAVDAERFKEMGDLLTTNLYLLSKGMSEITLDSFYHDNRPIKISLRPELPPMENVKRYYHKFNKAKSSQHLIEEQLNTNLAELEYVESLELSLEEASSLAELITIKNELAESGYIKQKVSKDKRGKNAKTAKPDELPPRTYQSSDGYTILVGRNNKQNDKLTLKQAAKNDIWLHTQKIPGSHVIIKRRGDEPISDVALLEAAGLAAWHSKAKNSSQVPVDYTTVNQVKKPNGAKPGMVIYFQQKTLYVTPKEL